MANKNRLKVAESKHKVLLVSNTSWYLYNFRRHLCRALRDYGFNVIIVSPRDKYTDLLQGEGFEYFNWGLDRKSLNPIKELLSIYRLSKLYRSSDPIIVHHFTIKACLYGTIAAKISGVYRVINAVTGLGHVFLGNRKRNSILRFILMPLYKAVFTARRTTMVFQNADDHEKLISLGIADGRKAHLIKGSGVDVSYFDRNKLTIAKRNWKLGLKVLFPSRLIKEKGVFELLEACELLWKEGFDFDLLVAGQADRGNRSALTASEYNALTSNPRVTLLGHVEDMRALYASVDLVILPSWREGLSRSLIEAASMELPIITTDVPGCRDVVSHGISGILVPKKDSNALRLAIIFLIKNQDFAEKLGKKARESVISNFKMELVNQATISAYSDILGSPNVRVGRFGANVNSDQEQIAI